MKAQDKEMLVIGGLLLGGYLLFKKLGGLIPDFGIEGGAAHSAVQNESISTVSPWNPQFIDNAPSGSLILTDYQADVYILTILDSFGVMTDDFAQVFGVFKSLKTQGQVSYLAKMFKKKMGSDLLTYLEGDSWPNDRLSADQVQQLINYVRQLPRYK